MKMIDVTDNYLLRCFTLEYFDPFPLRRIWNVSAVLRCVCGYIFVRNF